MSSLVKTSITDPLMIHAVPTLANAGLIGMTLCPGRKGSSMDGGSWDRDLTLDLEAVCAWQPDLVISLLEDHEYVSLGVPSFLPAVEAYDLPYNFVPIVDGDVPDARFFEAWEMAGPRARNALRRGGRVLIHCRAGLGRTGLVAAALLAELGEDPESAIRRVREARPNAIETRAQEAFVRRVLPLPGPTRESRVAGCMYGAAIGDALGSAFEFVRFGSIEAELREPFAWTYRDAIRGSLLYPRAAGQPTDDTAMALSVAHVIADATELSAARFASAFLTDLERKTGRYGEMFWDGGPGSATTRALRKLATGVDAATCGGEDDGGNGAAMRAHPIGLLPDRDVVLAVAAVQARVTHGHPSAVAAAQAVAVLVFDAMQGIEPELDVPEGIEDHDFYRAWRRAHRNLRPGAMRLPEHLQNADMSGWKTVAAAHAITYVYRDDPKRAIAAAAASGGDTDTIATIVGAIVGARHGVEALDRTLIDGLGSANLVAEAIARLP